MMGISTNPETVHLKEMYVLLQEIYLLNLGFDLVSLSPE